MRACTFFSEANILSKLVKPVQGYTYIVDSMAVSVQDVGVQFTKSLDSRLVQYVSRTREEFGPQQYYHMATDKAFASGMHLQNTLISVPDNRMALAPPQACFSSHHFPPLKV